jgi:ribosomal subunit interface protein
MNINLKATGIELTPAITDYAHKKIGALEKYLNEKSKDAVFRVEVGKTTNHHHKGGDIFKAEVNVSGGGLNMYAVEEAADLYAAIDLVEAELKRELTSEKGRRARLLRRGQRTVKNIMRGLRDRFGRD